FGWADDVLAEGNTFTADTMHATIGSTGCVAAYEVHGANQKFFKNTVKNCYRGIWVSSNYTSPATGIVVEGNTFSPVEAIGVDFFRENADMSAISNVG